MAGKMPAHLKTVVGEFLQPKLDWKTILRDTITSCAKNNYCWSPPNKKHVYRGIYLPGITGEEIRVAVCVDSSGSISDDDIKEFLSEVKGICDSYDEFTIYLFVADTRVHERYTIETMDPLPTVISGRGGTDFGPALKEADEKDATAIVYLTDLMPNHWNIRQPRLPVIWVSTTDGKVPWGSKIILPEGKGD
jgi:predicted metal-dependent peptidase